jgi:hypothetical protein
MFLIKEKNIQAFERNIKRRHLMIILSLRYAFIQFESSSKLKEEA